MKLRLAIAAAVLALSTTAVTPAPTVAAPPSGFVNCRFGFIVVPIGFQSGQELGQAVVSCVGDGGRIVSIQFGEG